MMSTEKKPAKTIYTLATAIGLALGTMGVAAAATSPADTPAVVGQTQTDAPDQATAPDDEADEVEAPSDEDVDGVDHQFEGEEVGNNGDGIADVNEADEIEADEAEAPGDEDVDGVDHQFEGEEIGNNGDGIPDADDANEAAEATTNG